MSAHVSTALSGRLGNHLFIIATAAAVARDARRDLHIYNTQNTDAAFTLRCVEAGMNSIGKQAVISKESRCPEKNVQEERNGALAFDSITVPPRSNVCIGGYRQHYKYFARHRDWILNNILAIPSRRTQTLREFGLPSLTNKIVVHVRRGDYARQRHLYNVLPVASDRYYVEALSLVAEKSGLTDAVMFCEEESRADVQATLWPLLKNAVPHINIEFAPLIGANKKKHAPWHELLWMSTASAFVIANSSYGWWSAWMSSAAPEQKVVTFPKEWTGLSWKGDAREMAAPDGSEGFGLWIPISNRKPSLDKVMCCQGVDFAARTQSVADEYELAIFDESSCGLLDRDFTFRGETLLRRKVCPPDFCVIDLTDAPLGDPFRVFTSIEQFLQTQPSTKPSWVVVRKDKSITSEHIFNDLWYVMQPKRFEINVDPLSNNKYGLREAPYNKKMFIIMEESLRKVQVPSLAWWEARPFQFSDKCP